MPHRHQLSNARATTREGPERLVQMAWGYAPPLIIEMEFMVDPDRTGPPMGLLFAVNMLVNTRAGDTFSFKKMSGWLRDAGFRKRRLLEVPAVSPLVLATKPSMSG